MTAKAWMHAKPFYILLWKMYRKTNSDGVEKQQCLKTSTLSSLPHPKYSINFFIASLIPIISLSFIFKTVSLNCMFFTTKKMRERGKRSIELSVEPLQQISVNKEQLPWLVWQGAKITIVKVSKTKKNTYTSFSFLPHTSSLNPFRSYF